MAKLDPLIHAPARLQVVTTLSAVSEAEFATLRTALKVSDSVLSKHISALADAGYVRSRKGVQAGRRTTWIELTSACWKALREHVAHCARSTWSTDPPSVPCSTHWQRPLIAASRVMRLGSPQSSPCGSRPATPVCQPFAVLPA